MVKSFNINVVIVLIVLITSIETAPVWDDNAIIAATRKMRKSATDVVKNRRNALVHPVFGRWPADEESSIIAQIAEVLSKPVPSSPPVNEEQLFQEPNESMLKHQVRFTSAYHSLVFEKLKTLFLKIQHRIIVQQNSEILKNGLKSVAAHLLRHQDLERKCRKRLLRLCSMDGRELHAIDNWRKLKLPDYDWERVCTIVPPTCHQVAQHQSPPCNDATTRKILERLQKIASNVVRCRSREICHGLPFNLHTVLSTPTSYVAARIARKKSVPRPFPFTEEQLLEKPNAFMPEDQLHLTRAYHCLVFEELKTLFLRIKYHISANENEESLEQALAEVGRA
ncbi:hypothetical protein SeLEV6574_g08326, partial [Synchytrium endobioticum]